MAWTHTVSIVAQNGHTELGSLIILEKSLKAIDFE